MQDYDFGYEMDDIDGETVPGHTRPLRALTPQNHSA